MAHQFAQRFRQPRVEGLLATRRLTFSPTPQTHMPLRFSTIVTRQPVDQRYESTYVFGAVCPARDTGAALILPYADTWAMQQHIDEIARHVAPGSIAVVLMDNAGWHRTGKLRWPAVE